MDGDINGRVEWNVYDNGSVGLTTHNGVIGTTATFSADKFGLLGKYLDAAGIDARYARDVDERAANA